MILPTLLTAGAALSAVAGLSGARRERRTQADRLAPLRPMLAGAEDWRAPDGSPRLRGFYAGRRYAFGILTDSLEVRRLPQLWLTVAASAPCRLPSLVVTARPRGDDFVSTAFTYPRQVDVPSWLPRDTMVRGNAVEDAMQALDILRRPLATLFEDPLVKEVAMGTRGYRLVYRLAEGRRANHLLLRQCRFDAQVEPHLLEHLDLVFGALDAARALPVPAAA